MREGADPDTEAGGLSRQYHGWCELLMPTELSGQPIDAAICALKLDGLEVEHTAMLDTGAHWSVLPYDVAQALGIGVQGPNRVRYKTRWGPIEGVLVTHSTRLGARQGEGIDLDVRWFVSDEWPEPPPMTVGWHWFLEKIAFGCDPGIDLDDQGRFYFAEL
ncbi:MAG: hypothetical protein JXA57_19190 [Armatimonadetes bacterium]|nr:hypothetical protein [Armatimonadota bacterium]